MATRFAIASVLALAVVGAALPTPITAQTYEPTWESLDSRPIPEWFEDAKFGIFIHWGVYSVPAWIRVTEGRYASYAEWYYARVMGELKGDEDFHERTFGADFEYRDFAPMFTAELFDPATSMFETVASLADCQPEQDRRRSIRWPLRRGAITTCVCRIPMGCK